MARVRLVKEPSDLPRVPVPRIARLFEGRCVSAPRGGEQIGGRQDVLLEQTGELVPGCLTVERLDGVPDVDLVLQQPSVVACRSTLGATSLTRTLHARALRPPIASDPQMP